MDDRTYHFWKTKAGNVIIRYASQKGKRRHIVVTKKGKELKKVESIFKLFWAIKKEKKIVAKVFKKKSDAIAYGTLIAASSGF